MSLISENDFLAIADRLLTRIEDAIEVADIDADCTRQDNVLTIEFDNGSKIIVNSQTPNREIWVAAKSGGYHYRLVDAQWKDLRNSTELAAALSKEVSTQSGHALILNLS